MSKTFSFAFLLCVILSLRVETNDAASTNNWKWKKDPSKCWSINVFRIIFSRDISRCQRACEFYSKCVMAQYRSRLCSMSSSYSKRVVRCSKKSVLLEKPYTITWKRHSPQCWTITSYREISPPPGSISKCQRGCEEDSKCVTAEYAPPRCFLGSSNNKQIHFVGCSRKNILLEKVITKRVDPSAKLPTTATTTSTTQPGPASNWSKHTDSCVELESAYSDFKVKNEAECQLKCHLDHNCLLMEYRVDHYKCRLSSERRFKKVKYCNYWIKIYYKDLKKCPSFGEICQENAYCENTKNAYQCLCKQGYYKWSDGSCGGEVNECSKGICSNIKNTICMNTPGSYKCVCKAGYLKGPGKECVKASHARLQAFKKIGGDKCTENNRPCPENAFCVRKGAKHECECKKGYEYILQKRSCEDINECRRLSRSKLGCGLNFECFNTIGSYVCACSRGFEKIAGKCEDVDECAKGWCGENMECQNTLGSYMCSCRKGYREELYWCNDIDECHGKNGSICGDEACVNAPGSYRCLCDDTSRNCKNKTVIGRPGEGLLKDHAVASFSGNSYMRFVTPSTLKTKASLSMWLTIRPDESTTGIIFYAEKIGHEKFFALALKKEFLEMSFDMGSGRNKLQSSTPLTADTWHGIEVIFRPNKVGLILNEQNPIFQKSGPLDIDDIFHIGGVANASDATPNVMKNVHINAGFQGCLGLLRIGDEDYDLTYPGRHIKKQENVSPCENVQDVDECAMNSETCSDNSVCTNTIGRFRCSCKEGYELADDLIRVCQDKDECETGNANCGRYARCMNTEGSYRCKCTVGFYNYTTKSCDDSKSFSMKNGWFENLDKCYRSACNTKIMQSVTVKDCKKRCKGDPTCAMIKFMRRYDTMGKCSLCQSTEFWPANRVCKTSAYDFYIKATKIFEPAKIQPAKTTESPKMLSTPGQSGSNRNYIFWLPLRGLCVHTDSYNPRHITTSDECTTLCEAEPGCVMAKYSSAASLCWLSKSRKMAPLGSGCDGTLRNIYDYYVKPLNECDGNARKCADRNSKCVFEKGHKYCKCRDGFEQHGEKCKDINECLLYSGLCGEHAKCVNIAGSYKCSCNPHYTGDGLICVHKKERHAISFGSGLASSS